METNTFAGVIVGASVLLQFVTAFFALRLIRITGFRISWVLISSSLFFMGVRRAISLFHFLSHDRHSRLDLSFESVGLIISLLMFLGVLFISPVFRSLKESEEKLQALSVTDELTGLSNRRGFMTLAEQQHRTATRLGKGICIVSADIDNLKRINDTFGHTEGDSAIVETARILRKTFREADIIARIGGDEFVVLMMEHVAADSDQLIARLRNNLASHNAARHGPYTLSLSVGLASTERDGAVSIDELLIRSDKMMYEEKRQGQEPAPTVV